MTLACVRRPACEARPAAWKASPSTYTPPWKYRTTWRGSIPSIVISAVGTAPSAAAVTVTSAGSGCAESNALSCRRCSLTSALAGKAPCRRIASRFSRCSVLTEDLPSVGIRPESTQADQHQSRRQAGEHASPYLGDSHDRNPRGTDLPRSGLEATSRCGCSGSLASARESPASGDGVSPGWGQPLIRRASHAPRRHGLTSPASARRRPRPSAEPVYEDTGHGVLG